MPHTRPDKQSDDRARRSCHNAEVDTNLGFLAVRPSTHQPTMHRAAHGTYDSAPAPLGRGLRPYVKCRQKANRHAQILHNEGVGLKPSQRASMVAQSQLGRRKADALRERQCGQGLRRGRVREHRVNDRDADQPQSSARACAREPCVPPYTVGVLARRYR
jgi:hypothetical protein